MKISKDGFVRLEELGWNALGNGVLVVTMPRTYIRRKKGQTRILEWGVSLEETEIMDIKRVAEHMTRIAKAACVAEFLNGLAIEVDAEKPAGAYKRTMKRIEACFQDIDANADEARELIAKL